jgi:hypothetical protein
MNPIMGITRKGDGLSTLKHNVFLIGISAVFVEFLAAIAHKTDTVRIKVDLFKIFINLLQ